MVIIRPDTIIYMQDYLCLVFENDKRRISNKRWVLISAGGRGAAKLISAQALSRTITVIYARTTPGMAKCVNTSDCQHLFIL